jgi:uncharacterized membrane protein YhaH (DUF805 family)
MNFGEAIASGFSKYLDFSGRASRPEYWLWVLFAVIGAITTNALDAVIFIYHSGVSPLNSPLSNFFAVVLLSPSLAVATRRLHDIDRTGWWMLLVFTGIGIIVLLYWQSQEGTSDDNRFGPNPSTAKRLRTRQVL